MNSSTILISSTDYRRLLALINSARLDRRVPADSVRLLEQELSRATVVEPAELPPDVVTMNSTVWFRDQGDDEVEEYTLVYPPEADVIHDRISVLAPIGTALLGYRVGDVVVWRVPSGRRRLEIIHVAQIAAASSLAEAPVAA